MTALQRLYAFWPALEVEVKSEDQGGGERGSERGGEYAHTGHTYATPLSTTAVGGVSMEPTPETATATAATSNRSTPMTNTNGLRETLVQVTCAVRLAWPDRYQTNRVFRDPDTFQPNVNCI
jgi:hypothetical protein